MPRSPRLVLPGLPHHITQRGNSRIRTFFGADDYRRYLDLLRGSCRKAGTSVWAWCLMPNHVHLILAPAGEDGLRATRAPVHTRYAGEINRREDRCGHLWQGRFASVPMDDGHLYACLRYVELNPVRARLVDRPEAWPWSSARAHLGLAGDGLTDLAATRGRIDDWRAFLDAGLDEADREAIRKAERSGRLRLKPRPRR
jgi:putative transposase